MCPDVSVVTASAVSNNAYCMVRLRHISHIGSRPVTLRAVNKGRCCSLRGQTFSLIPFETLGRQSGTSASPSASKLEIYGTRHWKGMSAATLYLLEIHFSYEYKASTNPWQPPGHSTVYAEIKQRPWTFRKTYYEPRFIRHRLLILELGVMKVSLGLTGITTKPLYPRFTAWLGATEDPNEPTEFGFFGENNVKWIHLM